uniref:Casein kinase I n=2 Tax=Alexandrium monilatum TaxID=311494 RepID=A0A7S4V490_9DINO
MWTRVQEQLPGCMGLPQLFDSGMHEGEPYAVTQLLGADLTKVIQRFDPWDRLRRWRGVRVLGRMVLRRLEALHSAGIVHCDVSPYNVLLGRPGGGGCEDVVPYIIDFGLARSWPGSGPLGAEHGTAEFASVRAAEGRERRPEDDLEALGWTMVWLLLGDLPWCEWQFEMKVHLELVARIRAAKLRILQEGWWKLRSLEPRWAMLADIPVELSSFMKTSNSLSTRPTPPPDYRLLAALLGGRRGLSAEEAEREDLREFRAHVWPML